MDTWLSETSNCCGRLVAVATARIPDSTVGSEKGVAILAGAERQLQDAEVPVNLEDGISREWIAYAAQLTATGSGDDLRNTLC